MGEKTTPKTPPTMVILLVLLAFSTSGPTTVVISAGPNTFTKKDNYLIDVGGTRKVTTTKGETFRSDEEAKSLLSAQDNHLISDSSVKVSSPVYSSARVFLQEATYAFPLQESGWHWVRLHFLPLKTNVFKLVTATFNVYTDELTLLHGFSYNNMNKPIVKEYLVNAKSKRFSIRFEPQKDSAAFINAIEVVTAPDDLISDTAQSLSPGFLMEVFLRNRLWPRPSTSRLQPLSTLAVSRR